MSDIKLVVGLAVNGSSRNVRSALELALARALDEVAETRGRRELDRVERRAKMRVVNGGRRTAA